MKVELWVIGKNQEEYLETGILRYEKRLKHYLPFQIFTVPDIKNPGKMSAAMLRTKEGETILEKIKPEDWLILLDEGGKQMGSQDFALFIDKKLQLGQRRLIFLIGGAFGFSDSVYARANEKLSLSKMTFTHQMVRLFFLEQLYRAMTILKSEPYHNP
jgi:23S rRNA (pseudouridine1915-N3)-methyltransferase